MLKNSWLVLGLLAASSSAYAIGGETGKITSISAGESTYISVQLDGTDYTAECSKGWRWTMHKDDPQFEAKYSLLLAAATAKQTVSLRHNSSTCGMYSGNIIEMIHVNY